MNGKCSPPIEWHTLKEEVKKDRMFCMGWGGAFLPKCHGRPPKYVTLRGVWVCEALIQSNVRVSVCVRERP